MAARVETPKAAESEPLRAFCEATAQDLQLLASLHEVEPSAEYLIALREASIEDQLGLKLVSERGRQALTVLSEGLKALPGVPDPASLDVLARDFASIYLTHGIQASPQESVWTDDEHLTCQESMFQVRAWYARHGLGAANWRERPDDHLVLQLQFLAHLLGSDGAQENLREAAQFMDEHLLRWLMSFAERVAARCETAYFAGATMLTAAYCEELRELMADILGESRPDAEEIERRMKPAREVEEVPVSYMPGMGPAV